MKRHRYSDASEERRKEIYLEELDKRKSMEKSRYMAGGLGVLCMLSFIAVAGYTAYPFLEMADKYKNNIEMRLVPNKDFINKQTINYKDNCENWIHGF